jgi:CubicO group peptidase (beta-lactamase class C family)
LDEPIYPYWIDPQVKDNEWNRLLTPRLCLSHQTGFPNWRYLTGNVLKFQWQPGTAFGYSGEGYDYVRRFVEKKTGLTWNELAQQYVFDPIDMKDTSYTPRPWWEGRQAKPVEPASRTEPSAADMLRSTVGDYARFVISVMKRDGLTAKIAGEQFVITRNLTTPEQESVLCEAAKDPSHCRVATGYGLGWHIVDLNGLKIIDHTGRDGDVMTFAFFVPSKQIGAVVFTNGPDVGHQMIDKVLNALYPNPVYAQTLWQ